MKIVIKSNEVDENGECFTEKCLVEIAKHSQNIPITFHGKKIGVVDKLEFDGVYLKATGTLAESISISKK